jgi:hypothetical protein
MNRPTIIKTFTASADIPRYRLVTSAADGHISLASGAGDALIGVNGELDADSGERADINLTGAATVEYGAGVSAGDLLTADSDGKAVQASPASGETARVIGMALQDGEAGDYGSALLSQGAVQG